MLDNSTIPGEDLDIMSGNIPPYMGPNIHDPLRFGELIEHHQKLNPAVARAAMPLTPIVAHSLPRPSASEREIQRTLSTIYAGGDDSPEEGSMPNVHSASGSD